MSTTKNFDLKRYFKEGHGCRTKGTFRTPNDFGVNKGLSNLPYSSRSVDRSGHHEAQGSEFLKHHFIAEMAGAARFHPQDSFFALRYSLL
jgi:hypothetical protein